MNRIGIAAAIVCAVVATAEPVPRHEVESALKRAVAFFRDSVSIEGGYLWQYSADLAWREGENQATETTAWVQPPGTPAVGMALLDVYEATHDPYYLDAAKQTAHALVRGQLQSGGWTYRIDFDPARRGKYAYRADNRHEGDNVSTLDDDTTQAALRFLMRADKALGFNDAAVHEAVEYALAHLIAAQYPNGAWPQRFSGPPDPAKYPVKAASYPETWSREYPGTNYADFYTFNDNTIADTIETLFLAYEIYGNPAYRDAAERGGNFILLAQMPDPQPAWAQQYDRDMHPAWARKFEPPAVTGGESQGVMRTLLFLYDKTGDKKFLEPIPRALAYLRSSLLPDGRIARFYELQTNTPLFFTKDYQLTYSSDDMPTHYAFIGRPQLDSIEAAYKARVEGGEVAEPAPEPPPTDDAIRAIIGAMDERGAWVESGKLRSYDDNPTTKVIRSTTFIENVRLLAQYLETSEH